MKKELAYFDIEQSCGWNQDWFLDSSMHAGGCAAVTACSLCIYLTRLGYSKLYPYNAERITRSDYLAFADIMKPYLRPRMQGIDTLDIYIEGITQYWQDRGADYLRVDGLAGHADYAEARQVIRSQIDSGMVVPYLLLYHKSATLQDFQWHWFNLIGYEEYDGEFYVKAVTYGRCHWLSLAELWDTGYQRKGGIIRVSLLE